MTDTQAAIGFILLAIGGSLVIWYCCTRTLGPKPQPREDLRPETYSDRVAEHNAAVADYERKRDKQGRFTSNSLTKTPKRVSAKTPRNARD
jgi:hypothetical protein